VQETTKPHIVHIARNPANREATVASFAKKPA
jgi:hypothetical protein